jgi:FkbM family methyltransferase
MSRLTDRIAVLERHPDAELRMHLDYALALRALHAPDFFFIQIGAFDGRVDDPLYAWVSAYRWRGILVEPQDRYFAELQKVYAGHDQLDLRRVAVADRPGTRTLYTIADEPGVPYWAGLLASFDKETMLKHREFLPEIDRLIREQQVECVAINDLLAEAPGGHIDLLQIDVEGYDFELVRAIDFERFAPVIVRFEHEHLSAADRDAAVELLIGHGYRIALEEHDTVAYRSPDGAAGEAHEAMEGPGRLQAEHDRKVAEQTEFYEDRIARLSEAIESLKAKLKEAAEWAQGTVDEAKANHERSLAEQREHYESEITGVVERLQGAERRVAELEAGDGRPTRSP